MSIYIYTRGYVIFWSCTEMGGKSKEGKGNWDFALKFNSDFGQINPLHICFLNFPKGNRTCSTFVGFIVRIKRESM